MIRLFSTINTNRERCNELYIELHTATKKIPCFLDRFFISVSLFRCLRLFIYFCCSFYAISSMIFRWFSNRNLVCSTKHIMQIHRNKQEHSSSSRKNKQAVFLFNFWLFCMLFVSVFRCDMDLISRIFYFFWFLFAIVVLIIFSLFFIFLFGVWHTIFRVCCERQNRRKKTWLVKKKQNKKINFSYDDWQCGPKKKTILLVGARVVENIRAKKDKIWETDGEYTWFGLARIRYTLRCRSNRTSFVMHSQLEGIRRLSKQTESNKQSHTLMHTYSRTSI